MVFHVFPNFSKKNLFKKLGSISNPNQFQMTSTHLAYDNPFKHELFHTLMLEKKQFNSRFRCLLNHQKYFPLLFGNIRRKTRRQMYVELLGKPSQDVRSSFNLTTNRERRDLSLGDGFCWRNFNSKSRVCIT